MEGLPRGGYAALRKGRCSLPNQIYLVTTVTRGRAPLFKDWRLGRILVHSLRRNAADADTLCYVVMPDHLHWLLSLKSQVPLEKLVGSIKGHSSRQIGCLAGLQGPLWQDGFHDRALRSDEEVLPVARYVVANPLRVRLVKKLGDYPLWDAMWL